LFVKNNLNQSYLSIISIRVTYRYEDRKLIGTVYPDEGPAHWSG